MSIRRGYEAIPNPTETESILNSSPSSSSVSIPPSSSHSQLPRTVDDSTFLQRLKHHINYHKHGLSALLVTSIILFLVLIFCLVTFLPNPRKSFYGYIEPPIPPGISSHSLQQGLAKCRNIRKSIIQSTNKDRSFNPRAPKDVQPVLFKNAIVWDGQGEILNNVDILLANGVIHQVKSSIQEHPANTKIIDVGGHIVSPGLVDMHT